MLNLTSKYIQYFKSIYLILLKRLFLLILDNTKTIREAIEKSTDKEDEENRIWYVGVTRTKQNLYIMAAKKEDKGYDIESIQ